jgi:hypothetical protein
MENYLTKKILKVMATVYGTTGRVNPCDAVDG